MKLKSILIHGFKSFADRVVINYHDGITGVIGPNGSGKSNIIDAVRWVMGEQTAKSLRADDPTDIIFAGSQTRKHMGQAMVRLTFSNTGTHCPPEFLHLLEISIERRISRSGEREYYMNNEECRFKDIVEFLLSVGLGSKSYSIIQQERRDRIIQASPDEMREILEEAAGISVFKARRKEAEKRLESTGTTLANLVDIEAELTKQRDSLKEQVVKASQKLALTTELRDKEVAILHDRVGVLRGKASKFNNEIQQRLQEVQSKTVETTEWETRANDLQTQSLDLASQVHDLKDLYDEKRLAFTKLKERMDNQKAARSEKIQRKSLLADDISQERKLLGDEEVRVQGLALELENLEGDFKKIDAELETLQWTLEEIDESLQVERTRGEEIRSEIRALHDLISSLRTRNEALLEVVNKANNGLQKNDEAMRDILTSKGQILADRREIETQLAQISKGLELVAQEKSRIEGELSTLDAQVTAARDERDVAKERHLELTSTFNSLAKLVQGSEGLSDGARLLREKLAGNLRGFLFENITVHKDDEALLETALPELLEAALVDNTEILMDVLDKAEELGATRVSFVVREFLAALTPTEQIAATRIASIPGLRSLGARAERVAFPELKHLLDRIFIARDEWLLFKAAREVGPELKNTFVFVSERGTVLSGARELHFGENKDGEGQGLLKRKRELAEITQSREEAQARLALAEGALYQLTERKKTLSARLAEIDQQFSKEQVEAVKLGKTLENYDTQVRNCEANLTRVEEERKVLAFDMEEGRTKYSANQTQIDRFEGEKLRLQRDLDDFESDLFDKKERRDAVYSQLSSKKSDRSVKLERQAGFRTNYEQSRIQLGRLRDKVDRGISQLADLDGQIAGAEESLQSAGRELAGLEHEQERLHEEHMRAVNEEAAIDEQRRVIDNRLKSQRDQQAATEKVINEKRVHLSQIQAFLDVAIQEAQERFGLAAESLPNFREDEPDIPKKLESRIKKIQAEILELGPVNERAVDEFKEVEQRLEFLITQKDDILRSAEDLRKSIAEIEETTKVRFKNIFETVDGHFQKIFPILFPSGEARLNLLKPDCLLTTGVEILVRLPGKKQQNMSLFSGGEKALTAISLIFSLLKTTPAPFCFLDEVDAPLDEANVGRFNDILEALADDFQFVVITHNRRTMEVLDTIYGISMTEPGVSKIVAVGLDDAPVHLRKKPKVLDRPVADRPGASANS